MFAPFNYDIFTVKRVCAPQALHLDSENIRLSSITTSSLEVKPGSLFVPLIDRRDGHDYIQDAVARGAAAFLMQAGHAVSKKLTKEMLTKAIVVEDTQKALGDLARFHRDRFAAFIVAVTGSNGKTTTKEMLAQMFRAALGKKSLSTEKNYNNHIGVPFTLFRINKDTRVAIVEMGMNHAGEIGYLSRMARPHAAVISSIGHAHIEFLGSRRAIARAKSEILEGMPKGGYLYVPKSVAEYETISATAKKHGALLRKIDASRGAALQIVEASPKGYQLQIETEPVQFSFANAAWVSNLALAVQVAIDSGIQASQVLRAVRSFRPAAGRMQLRRGRFTVIDDGYNANPDSAIASIDSAVQIAAGRPVICIFGEFKELGKFSKTLHQWTGSEAARKGVAAFFGMGDDMRYAVQAFSKASAKKTGATWFRRSDTASLVEALSAYPKSAVVLVKGSRSMKMEEVVDLLL